MVTGPLFGEGVSQPEQGTACTIGSGVDKKSGRHCLKDGCQVPEYPGGILQARCPVCKDELVEPPIQLTN